MRLSLLVGDLSGMVPPVATPIGAATLTVGPGGAGTFNQWSLASLSPGGLTVLHLANRTSGNFDVFLATTNPFAAPIASTQNNLSSGEFVRSLFRSHAPAAKVAPASAFQIHATSNAAMGIVGEAILNYIGPGEFFCIEGISQNVTETMPILWKEYTGALSPG
jgi:hypothetical protein